MEPVQKLVDPFWSAVNSPIAGSEFTVMKIIIVLTMMALLIMLVGRVTRWLVEHVFVKRGFDAAMSYAIGTILKYIIVTVGFLVILQTAGIDLSALTVLLGALGVGIGFGLQNVVGNFVSGLVLLFERPVKVGDRIEVADVAGTVRRIGARATTVVTNDNIAILVPNSQFISEPVINWSFTGRLVRVRVSVGVAYGTDPELVKRVLLQVAQDCENVEETPEPTVEFREFGDSSLNFDLLVWTTTYTERPDVLRSVVNFGIAKALKENGIEIPFPQRDLHVKSGTLVVRKADSDEAEGE